MQRKVLITGACGFLGRHLARKYKTAGYSVLGMGHGDWPVEEQYKFGIDKWHNCTVTFENLCLYSQKPDLIVHCAGSGSVGFSIQQPMLDFKKTVCSLIDVLDYARQYSPESKIIFPSSAAVYGDTHLQPIKENHELNPISPYGLHKKIAEELCKLYSTNYNLSITIVRLFSVYGEELKKQLLWDACNKAIDNNSTFWGTGQEKRDWVYIDDVVEAFYLIGEKFFQNFDIINLGINKSVTTQEVISTLFENFNINSDKICFNGQKDLGNPHCYQADNTKMLNLGWLPRVPLQEGIKKYVEWYKKSI